MTFTVSAEDLKKQLLTLNGAVSTSGTLPILESFLFDVSDAGLSIAANDLETAMRSKVSISSMASFIEEEEAKTDKNKIAIPARILLDTLKTLPEQPLTFHINMDTWAVEIVSENGSYKMGGEDGEDFPEPPTPDEDAVKLKLPAAILLNAINKTLFATSSDDLRPAMTGVLLDVDNLGTTFVATDAQKLVKLQREDLVRITDEEEGSNKIKIILPRKTLSLLKSSLPSDDTEIDLAYDTTNAFFSFNNIHLSGRLIDARYPDYRAVIPNYNPNKLTINRKDFLSTLKRISIFTNKTTYQVNLGIQETEVKVSGKDYDFSNEASETLACRYEGDLMEIAFNAKFLMEILNVMDTEEVTMELSTPNKAGIVVPGTKKEHEELVMLIMPIVLN